MTAMTAPVYVLGAPDPERAEIEALLEGAGVPSALATANGSPVHPGSAYRADGTEPDLPAGTPVVLVECGGPVAERFTVIARCDHHRPGDPGYGRPPQEYLPASSLGQVIALLAAQGLLPDAATAGVDRIPATRPRAGELRAVEYPRRGRRWRGWEIAVPGVSGTVWRELRRDVLCAAAADHCLAAAYRGACPGVTPGRLLRWRVATRAAHQGRSVASVERDVRAARVLLAAAPRTRLGGVEVADMRPGRGAPCGEHGPTCSGRRTGCWGNVPELPEAAARDGVPFLAIPRPGPGERKLVLQAAPPQAVEAFLRRHPNAYGDPARGFAGTPLARAHDGAARLPRLPESNPDTQGG